MLPRDVRKENKKAMITTMIKMYCDDKAGTDEAALVDGPKLTDYCCARIDECPRDVNHDQSCRACDTPCINAEMRSQLGTVMRYVAPLMPDRQPALYEEHVRGKEEAEAWEAAHAS